MVLASASFAAMTLSLRLGCGRLPALESVFARGLIDALVLLPILLVQRVPIPGRHWRELFVRGSIGAAAVFCIFSAMLRIPVAEASALFRSSGLLVPFIAWWVIKEKLVFSRVFLAALGFVGVLLILKPGQQSFSVGGIFALVGAFFNATAYVTIRHLSKKENPFLIAFAFFVLSATYSLLLGRHTFVTPTASELFYLGLVGFFGVVGQYWVTLAFASAPASVITPWGYFEIAFNLLFGMLFLAQTPDLLSLVGIGVLILSAVLIART